MIDIFEKNRVTTIILKPENSSIWSNNILLIKLIFLHLLIISILFIYLGTWMIIPFAGLEVIVLYTVLYIVSKKSHTIETITLTLDQVTLSKGQHKVEQEWHFKRYYCKFSWENIQNVKTTYIRVYIGSNDQMIEIGQLLTLSEKRTLVKHLRQLLTEQHLHS